jgi:hypothetical protein
MGALHPAPDVSAVTKKLAKPDRHGGGYRLALPKNVVEVLAGDPQERGNLRLGLAGRRDHFLAQQLAGMRRTPIWIAFSNILSHGPAPQWYCSKSTYLKA